MPTPLAPRIIVAQNAQEDLHTLVQAPTTPHALALRARIVLRAADLDPPTNRPIGRELRADNHTVGQWRRRYRTLGFSGWQDALRSGRPRRIASSPRLQVLAVASTRPHDQERTVTGWPLDAIVAPLLDARHPETISRSSLWRILHDVDLTPQKRADWLHSPDADCEAHAHPLCQRDAKAMASYEQGRLVIGCDAKTGRPVLERPPPPKPAQPARRDRRAHAYLRHGTRVLSNSWAVATGHRAWTIGTTRKTPDCVAHLQRAAQALPRMAREDWVLDHLNTHWSLAVCRVGARWGQGPLEPEKRTTGVQRRAFLRAPHHRHVVHGTPKHGSWLNQAALLLRVLHRRLVARGSFPSATDFDRRLERFWQDDDLRHAHPSRWTSTGEPCVRDTPLSRTRRQQGQGRACFSPRPTPFERLLYAPRPYRRQAA